MTSKLKPNQLNQLIPTLKGLTQIIVSHEQVSNDDLSTLILGTGLNPSPDIENELRVWARLLEKVYKAPDAHTQTAVSESLKLRGLHEAAITLAINNVLAGKKLSSQSNLEVSNRYLNLGSKVAGKSAFGEFIVLAGGPGRVIVDDDDRIYVDPSKFGISPTRIKVEVKPMIGGGVSQNTIKILSDQGDSIDVGVSVDWSNVTVTQPDVTKTSNKPSKPPNSPDPVRQPQIVKEGRMATPPQPVITPITVGTSPVSLSPAPTPALPSLVLPPTTAVTHPVSLFPTQVTTAGTTSRVQKWSAYWGEYILKSLGIFFGYTVIGAIIGALFGITGVAVNRGVTWSTDALFAGSLQGVFFGLLFGVLASRNKITTFWQIIFGSSALGALILGYRPSAGIAISGLLGLVYFALSAGFIAKILNNKIASSVSRSWTTYFLWLLPIYGLGTWLSVILTQRAELITGVQWMGVVGGSVGILVVTTYLFSKM